LQPRAIKLLAGELVIRRQAITAGAGGAAALAPVGTVLLADA